MLLMVTAFLFFSGGPAFSASLSHMKIFVQTGIYDFLQGIKKTKLCINIYI